MKDVNKEPLGDPADEGMNPFLSLFLIITAFVATLYLSGILDP